MIRLIRYFLSMARSDKETVQSPGYIAHQARLRKNLSLFMRRGDG